MMLIAPPLTDTDTATLRAEAFRLMTVTETGEISDQDLNRLMAAAEELDRRGEQP